MKTDSSFVAFSTLANASVRSSLPEGQEKEKLRRLAESLGQSTLIRLTTKAKMLPFLARLLIALDFETQYWQAVSDRYADRNRQVLKELARIYDALHTADCKKVFVSENFGALLAADSDISLFASGDIDNYVAPEEYDTVSRTLLSLGYTRQERYSGGLLISAEFTDPETLPDGFAFGFDLFPLSRLTQPCFIDADAVTDWTKLRYYKDTKIALPPKETLLYICLLHISLHSFCRAPAIRLYRDIVNASRGVTPQDLDTIAAMAKCDGTERRLYTAAAIANQLAKTQLPLSDETDCTKLLSLTFDRENNILLPEPSRLRVMRIELACHDKGSLAGLHEMLLPDKDWMQCVYGTKGIAATLKHIRRII